MQNTRYANLASYDRQTIQLLNISLHNYTLSEFLQTLQEGSVFTTNIDHLARLQKDPLFYQSYQQADYRVCDSRILYFLSKTMLLSSLKAQIAGPDLLKAFYQYHCTNPTVKIFLLGGNTAKSVERASININKKTHSSIIVNGYAPPFGFEHNQHENQRIIDRVNASGATVLVVSVGSPKQEHWIVQHRGFLPDIKIFLAVGAAIEFESGGLSRAPRVLTKVGLEWGYRLWCEPKRLWKRYLIESLPVVPLLIRQRIGSYRNPWMNH